MKRIVMIIGIVAIVAALTAGTAWAFYTREDTARNVITAGNLDFEIRETMSDGDTVRPFPETGVQVLPGDIVSKKVTVVNTGSQPLYLRMRLTKAVSIAGLPAENCLVADLNTVDWESRPDGYCYYKRALPPAAETEPLFTKVTVDGAAVDNRYLGATFTLNVAGFAVQSQNNGNTVFDAVGWDSNENTQ